jgi:hypothetical protein
MKAKEQSTAKILNIGLLTCTAWLIISGGVYRLLSKSAFLDWLLWSLMATGGILLVVATLFANRLVLNILWVASGLAIFPVWMLLLILHNGVWPARWPERILHLIPSVGFLILFVTLLIVFGKALYARFEQS